MTDQDMDTQRGVSRREFLSVAGAGLAGAALLGASGQLAEVASARTLRGSRSITLGNIGWDENMANSNLTDLLLTKYFGYNVQLKLADVGILFEGVAKGDLAAFQDVWMPNHAAFFNKVKNDVEMLPSWYIGTTKFSMAAPSYMHINSISQINSTKATAIYGIEPGAAITPKIRNNVIPEYHLKQQFIASSTAAMLSEVKTLYKAKKPFIFVAWAPHWMNYVYKFNYLSDPKGALGVLTHPSRLRTIVHKGLRQSDPVAYALLRSMRLTAGQVNQMEFDINKAGSATQGVADWLSKNKTVVQPWIAAAKKA